MSELALALIRQAKAEGWTTLDLGRTGLTELPEALFELEELETGNGKAIALGEVATTRAARRRIAAGEPIGEDAVGRIVLQEDEPWPISRESSAP